MKLELYSEKIGKQDLLIDEDDYNNLKRGSFGLYTSDRHHTNYCMYYNPSNKTQKKLHRLITNAKTGEVVDHINGNGLDNRKCNLRLTTQRGNNKNARKRRNAKTSNYKGTHFSKGESKWKAQIQVDGKKMSLGTYLTEIEAAKAYNRAALKYHKEFAYINNIKETK